MVMIPQITRERLASSVVGAPAIDTSGQKIGEALGGAGADIANTLGTYAIQIQQQKDEAEYNRAMVSYKSANDNAVEAIKQKYASDPDKASDAILEAMQQNLSQVQQTASNPRVGRLMSKGDPQSETWSLKEIAQWGSKQGYENTKQSAINTLNDLSAKAAPIGSNLSLSPEDMKSQLTPLINILGSKVNEIKASRHPELADGVERSGMQSILKSLFDNSISTQPEKANALAADPEYAQYFKPDEVRQMKDQALKAVSEFPAKLKNQQITDDLAQHPQLVSGVANGKIGFADIDAAQKKDVNGMMSSTTYGYLKDIALKSFPEQAIPQQENLKSAFVDEVFRLGVNLKNSPTGFNLKNLTVTSNIKDLYKVQDDLLSARARNLITPAEFNTYYSKLYVPLVQATLAKHDSSFMDKANASGLNPFASDAQKKVDDFNQAYRVIDNYFTASGADKQSNYFTNKAAMFDEFFKRADQYMQPGVMKPSGGNYTAADVAHEVLGTSIGSTYNFGAYGMRKIDHYTKSGEPAFTSTKEDDQILANQKALDALNKRK